MTDITNLYPRKTLKSLMDTLKVDPQPISEAMEIGEWLNAQTDGFEYLLAHTHSGVVWGRFVDGSWVLSNNNPIDKKYLLEMRVFGPDKEIFVWRSGSQFVTRLIQDPGVDVALDRIADQQILWGTAISDQTGIPAGFTMLEDGEQGLQHAVPLDKSVVESAMTAQNSQNQSGDQENRSHRVVKLRLCHYLAQDEESGLARIVLTRLTGIDVKK